MRNQVDDFAAKVKVHAITFDPETTLFFIAGGLNDRNLTSATTVANLSGEIKTLYDLGGRRFAVALLPTAIPGFSDVGKRLNPELARIPAELSTATRRSADQPQPLGTVLRRRDAPSRAVRHHQHDRHLRRTRDLSTRTPRPAPARKPISTTTRGTHRPRLIRSSATSSTRSYEHELAPKK